MSNKYGSVSLVCAIIGFLFYSGVLFGAGAVILASIGIKKDDKRTISIVALVIGIICIIIGIIFTIFYLI